MPSLSNPEHQVILNMCARIHELTPPEKSVLTSSYLRATKLSQGVDVESSTLLASVSIPLEDGGKIAVVYQRTTGIGVMIVKQSGSTQLRFLQVMINSTEEIDAMLERALTGPPDNHHVDTFPIPGGEKVSVSTNPLNGLSAIELPGDEEPLLVQLWNAERVEKLTSTVQVHYWSPITQGHRIQPAQTPA